MDGFITEMEHARGVISEHTAAIRQTFATEGVPATSLDPIAEIEHWIDTHLPDLRRRTKLAHETTNLPNWSPTGPGALIPYQEQPLLPATEARRQGTDLATKYKELKSNSWYSPSRDEDFREIVNTLAAHVNDPEYTAAFFAALGTKGTRELPIVLRKNLAPGDGALAPARPDDDVLRTVGLALATAVSAGSGIPGFSQVKDGLRKTAPEPEQVATSLLLSAGKFPTEWLAQVAVANGLRNPRKVTPGVLNALANNPAAARLALNSVTDNDPVKLKKYLQALTHHTSALGAWPAEVNAFGRMLAAASGAYDERDGKHSREAATFAFTVITALGGMEVGEPARINMAEIAGAYATEIMEGANLGDTNHLLDSAFSDVTSRIPGLDPQFRLSPKDTYRFLKTFTDSTNHQVPFQAGMEILTTRLIGEAAPVAIKSSKLTVLDDTFAALGNVRGLQLAAQEVQGQKQDNADEAFDKVTSFLIGTGIGFTGLVPPFETMPLVWTTFSTLEAGADTFKPEKETETDKIRKADDELTLGRRYIIAQSLMAAGFTPKIWPSEYQADHPASIRIADTNGLPLPFAAIAKKGEPGLDELDRWFMENGLGGTDDLSLGKVSERLADHYNGQKAVSTPRARFYDN
ncbi:DUF6571 family protein [Sphaerisporangium corydalis]|uniref:DUF6571 family protein n=1 Tax=Sphaerisporangium corydalis TaxID=1441875 RepID=A0ABV9ENR0_9ACTN|nr:DUF6571 family protein [Sphaerisporangium corydalis]